METTATDAPKPVDTNKIIAGNVRAELARRSITRAQVGDLLNLERATVHRRYSGTVPFKSDELVQIANEFDIPLSTLMDIGA